MVVCARFLPASSYFLVCIYFLFFLVTSLELLLLFSKHLSFFILLVLSFTQSIVNLFRVLFLFNKISGSLFTTTTNSILLYLLIFANSRWNLELQLVAFQGGRKFFSNFPKIIGQKKTKIFDYGRGVPLQLNTYSKCIVDKCDLK